jgi:hypothetical protein
MNILNPNIFNGITLEQEPQPLKQGKAGGWGQTYHWVSLPVTQDDIEDTQKFNESLGYCKETFGKEGVRWFEKDKKFFFKDEKDLTLFLLRVG